jgi:hypothetical protein
MIDGSDKQEEIVKKLKDTEFSALVQFGLCDLTYKGCLYSTVNQLVKERSSPALHQSISARSVVQDAVRSIRMDLRPAMERILIS